MDSSGPPPPPPKRTVQNSVPAPALSSSTSGVGSFWDKLKPVARSGWDGLYQVSDKVGAWSNKQTAKMGVEGFYPSSLEVECGKAARILRTFTMDAVDLSDQATADLKKTQKVLKKIPPHAIAQAQGLAIFTVFRTGWILAGSGGSGLVIARQADGSWSAPSGILLHTIGFGFLAGADIYDVVLILRTRKAVDTFAKVRVTLGAEIAVSAGPVGNGAMLESGIEASPVWSYTKSKGLYGGVQVDGNIMIERNDENERSYGRKISAAQVLAGEVPTPHWSSYNGLFNTILAAEGKDYSPAAIPKGVSPSEDLSASQSAAAAARRLPPEELDEEDLAARREMEEAMRSFGIAEGDHEAHLAARLADPHLQRADSGSDINTPPYSAGVSSPESSLRPFSLAPSETGHTEPPALPPRPSVEIDAGRPMPPPRSDTLQSPLLMEMEDGDAPPAEETARRSVELEMDEPRKSSESARASTPSNNKPPVPPRRSPRVGVPAVEPTTPIITDSPVVESPVVAQEESKGVHAEESSPKVSQSEDGHELDSDAGTTFEDAESQAERSEDEKEAVEAVAKAEP